MARSSVAIAAICGAVLLSGCGSKSQSNNEAIIGDSHSARSVPAVTIDDSLLPIRNVEITFPSSMPAAGDIASTGLALKSLSTKPAAATNVSAINVLVRGSDQAIWFHLTLPGDAFRKAVAADRPAGYFLLLGREVGFNKIESERAARSYCAGASTSFCDQVG
jgi:hypothetical protein